MIADSLSFANCDDLDHEVLLVTCPEHISIYSRPDSSISNSEKYLLNRIYNYIIMNIIFNYFQTF